MTLTPLHPCSPVAPASSATSQPLAPALPTVTAPGGQPLLLVPPTPCSLYLEALANSERTAEELSMLYYQVPYEDRQELPSPFTQRVEATLFETFGSHTADGETRFRVVAPAAEQVELLLYSESEEEVEVVQMEREGENWIAVHSELPPGQLYRYRINGSQLKLDPFGRQQRFSCNHNKGVAPYSVVVDSTGYQWEDSGWMEERGEAAKRLNILEVHPTIYRRNEGKPLSYQELAEELIAQCALSGHTHIEFMGIQEHPYEPSMGYQITGCFAPNSRLGGVDDFKKMVDLLHQNGIGVILDFIPAHFAIDAYGLIEFDGASLFEDPLGHQEGSRQAAFGWGTHFFDYNKKFVRDFMVSAALFWIREMHLDGLRVDSIEGLIVAGNPLGAELFMRELNSVIHKEAPDVITAGEDMSGSAAVTKRVAQGGFGFDYRWGVEWRHAVLAFFSANYRERDGLLVEFVTVIDRLGRDSIRYISHDEIEFERDTIICRFDQGYPPLTTANIQLFYSVLLLLPGQKLLPMGSERGKSSGIWQLLREKRGLMNSEEVQEELLFAYFSRLSQLCATHPALQPDSKFEWLSKEGLLAYRLGEKRPGLHVFHNMVGSEKRKLFVSYKGESGLTVEPLVGGDGAMQLEREGQGYWITVPPLTTVVLELSVDPSVPDGVNQAARIAIPSI